LKLTPWSLLCQAACVFAASASVVRAQSIEPRAYSNAPVGVNFLIVGTYYTRGGLSFDTSLPLTDPKLDTTNAVVGYARTLDKAGVTLFTTNTDFFNGNRRSQDPLYSIGSHAIYNFDSGIWASVDATYFAGGRSTLNDTLQNDLQQNWRVGGTLSFPVDARNSIKLYASSGVSSRTGNSFDLIGIAWQYRWGAGL
jgi:hypothetical protein